MCLYVYTRIGTPVHLYIHTGEKRDVIYICNAYIYPSRYIHFRSAYRYGSIYISLNLYWSIPIWRNRFIDIHLGMSTSRRYLLILVAIHLQFRSIPKAGLYGYQWVSSFIRLLVLFAIIICSCDDPSHPFTNWKEMSKRIHELCAFLGPAPLAAPR